MNADDNEDALERAMIANADAYHNSDANRQDWAIYNHENSPSKGPWTLEFVDQSPDEDGYVDPHEISDSDGRVIAMAYRSVDARLIAAAPDLLDAVRAALEMVDAINDNPGQLFDTSEHRAILEAAIVKATQPTPAGEAAAQV